MRLLTRALAVTLVALAAALCLAPGAHALSGEQAVAALNAQRAASGIPAAIAHVPAWSNWCALHNAYQRANGGGLMHAESPGAPGYTPEGAQAAANSVLARGSWDAGNPWETAPIHLHQLLAPRLDAMGVDDSGGYVCATTLLSRNRPAPAADAIYVYPGQGVRHRASEIAAEGPYTPGQRVGIAAGTRTGPYLYASVDGPGLTAFTQARMTAGTLTGPDGPVAVARVDNYTSGLVGYLPPGGELIALQPLRARRSYTAHVRFEVGAPVRAIERTWSFLTLGLDPATSFAVEQGSDGIGVRLTSASPGPVTLRATRPATGEIRNTLLRRGERTPLILRAGRWALCASQPADGDYEGHLSCREGLVAVPARPRIGLRLSARTRSTLRLRVDIGPPLAGRRLQVTLRTLRTRCRAVRGRRTCGLSSTGSTSRQRSLLASAVMRRLTVARPSPRTGLEVRVRSVAFESGDVTVPAASVVRRYRR